MSLRFRLTSSIAATLFCSLATAGLAENCPRFRGAAADGVSRDDPRLPSEWSETNGVKWTTEIPGWGWSCPVVWGDKIFLTSVVSDEENRKPEKGLYLGFGVREPGKGEHRWLVHCLDLKTGELLWQAEAHRGKPQVPRHPKSTYAAETVTCDQRHVYILFGDVGLYCYDHHGMQQWSHAIEPRKTFFDYGAAASPVVHENQVIYVYDNLEDSYVAALDTDTGQVVWKTERQEQRSWATPFIWEHDLRTEIVVPGKKRNRSYDLSGELLWEFDGNMSGLVIPSPFAAHGMVYLTSGYIGDDHRPVFAVKPGATGDITNLEDPTSNPFIAWYQPTAGPYNPSPIVYGDHYYTLHDRGFLTCHDAHTGEQVYGKRRFAPGASFTASPWAYNGKLFFLSEEGDTFVVRAGPEYELLATNSLSELCLATPAVSQGRLLIRTASKLHCLSKE